MATSGLGSSLPKPANQGGHAAANVAPTKTAGTPGSSAPTKSTILYSNQPSGIGGAKPTSGAPIK